MPVAHGGDVWLRLQGQLLLPTGGRGILLITSDRPITVTTLLKSMAAGPVTNFVMSSREVNGNYTLEVPVATANRFISVVLQIPMSDSLVCPNMSVRFKPKLDSIVTLPLSSYFQRINNCEFTMCLCCALLCGIQNTVDLFLFLLM